jgi:hypothetical protein
LRQEELRRESCRAREELRRVRGSGDGGEDEAESGGLAWLELVRQEREDLGSACWPNGNR